MGKLPHILLMPFPAQGHIIPLIEFSHQLVDHGIKVTFVNTEFNHKKYFSTVLHQKDEQEQNQVHLVSVPDGLDAEDDRKDTAKFIGSISKTIPIHLEELIKKINESDDEKIDCVIADAVLEGVLEVAEKLRIKRAAFWSASLGVLAFMFHVPKLLKVGAINDKGISAKKDTIILFPGMPAMYTVEVMWGTEDGPNMRQILMGLAHTINKAAKVANWQLCNSFDELEPASHDYNPDILTIGPLHASDRLGQQNCRPADSTCLAWLDQQTIHSVIYVAFGSTTVFNKVQFNEMAHGLELVDQPFLWVVRSDLTDDLVTSYPDGFIDRIAHRGKVVDWAPQQKVLAHPSIACFVTHCGWNSTIEGVSMGVPLLCSPYFVDQFHNQNYICDIWKTGLRLNKDENGIITRSEVKMKLQELLSNEGIRSRANKLKDMAWKSVSEGGSSSKNLKDFIEKIKC